MASRVAGVLLVLVVYIATVMCQNQCSSINIRTCGECISVSGCAWCFQEGFIENRCQPISNFSSACDAVNIANPSSSVTMLNPQTQSSPVSLVSAEVSLRVGDPVSFEVQVTPQRNLPLDLYILIDLSGSMDAELETIKQVSSSIATNIQNITNNVRLGLGAFNDKIARPFSQVPIDGVCLSNNPSCNSYAFRHVINLTDNSTFFATTVNELTLTENVDPPENGLSGLAQVIACEQELGWRARADGSITRVVLFMTDNTFHYAGEGRLAGIVRPYTGECLLRHNPRTGFLEYTLYDEYDYPSIGQVLTQMDDFDVAVIFAVRDTHVDTYQELIELLNTNSRRSSVDSFSPSAESSQNERAILDLINREYARLLQEVSLAVGDGATDLDITFTPMCPTNATLTSSGSCAGVPFETSVPFNVTVNLKTCDPADHGTVRMQKINSPSFGNFLIQYTIICNCDCSRQSFFDPNQCSGKGNRSCGVCECFDGRCGAKCDRELNERTNVDCPTGGINNEICSGPENGICDCGCRCNSVPGGVITGEACQCNDFGCPESKGDDGRTCRGRGLCCSGSCACHYVNATTNQLLSTDPTIVFESEDRYRGDGNFEYCQCESVNRACRQRPGAPICNNQGTCGCNFCLCNPMYKGYFCELPGNDSCGFQMDLDCILGCRDVVNNQEEIPDICSCSPTRPVLYISMDELEGRNSAGTREYYETVANTRLGQSTPDGSFEFVRDQCTAIDSDNCEVDYVILANATNSVIVAIRERDCTMAQGFRLPIPNWALALILLGCLLIVGALILILIRIILSILDYLELKRWENEARDADFSKNQNPLYQSPEMKYENVAYGRE